VAVTIVVVIVAGGGTAVLAVFSQQTNAAIVQLSANAASFGASASASGIPFQRAAIEFETQQRREGITSFAFVPLRPRDRQPPPGGLRPPPTPPGMRPPAGFGPPEPGLAVVDGVVRHGVSARARFEGNRFGFAVATLFGVRVPQAIPFAGGLITFVPDIARFQTLVIGIVAATLVAAIVVGILAAVVGTLITQQAIRPLVEVTEALQRFAARDFRAQPITVAGRSDFGGLANAYNAASAQVADAFAERDAAEAQMRQFVADAGHELRTPLTIVLGYIDLLRKRIGSTDDRSKFIFASIAAEGRRMRTLVDNLVLLARLEGEDIRPVEPFDVGDLLREIADVRRGLDARSHISIDAHIDGSVVGDRVEIHEAVANIVDNAIKYAPGSPVLIELDSPRAGTITIAVSDTGPGIPATDRDAIFERFFRGANRGDVEGSGLGLAIAKRALERAGGTLALDTTVTSGTRFIITLRAERIARRATFV
jgi:two-component system OmpR family sensor kinase